MAFEKYSFGTGRRIVDETITVLDEQVAIATPRYPIISFCLPAAWYSFNAKHLLPPPESRDRYWVILPLTVCTEVMPFFSRPRAIFGNLVIGRHMRHIVHTSQSVTCTTWGSRLAVRPSPVFLNIFNIAVFSGNTSAISSLIPASRAIAMRWRISAAPIPCP